MAEATFLVPNFLSGEISQFAQGRVDRPEYRFSLNVCLNSFPVEAGAWTRRPGTMHAGHTRSGQAARKIKFDFEQANAVTLEFTDGYLRFRSGATLLGTNDSQTVVAVSAANPAVVQLGSAVTWATGNSVIFPGASTPLLENRQFVATKVDTTHFSLTDALTGATIDGSTLGAITAGATIKRVQELATVYVSGSWADVRAVQAETTDILLNGSYAPQALTVATMPDTGVDAQFAIAPAIFNDGPYLDPPINGVQVTPSALSGLITLLLTFTPYSAAKAYAKGAFVTSAGIDYISLADQNVGNTPAISPTFWATASASTAVNDGLGFLGTDVGRLVRLLSEPPIWSSATAYVAGNIVTYNPSGTPGASTYWQALAGSTSKAPGSDLTNWQIIPSGAAIWTWGKITSLSNVIDRALAGSTSIGDMTSSGGINAPFDGVFSKAAAASAQKALSTLSGFSPTGTPLTLTGFVGKNYSGASAQRIQQVTIYPSTNLGFGNGDVSSGGPSTTLFPFYTLNLRAKNTAPSSSSDGALLGTTSFSGSSPTVTIISNDQATSWNYVWIEIALSITPTTNVTSWNLSVFTAQISFFSPTSSSSASAGCTMEILGPALLYTQPITTSRLGAYSNTTGWPTCGCYYEGRIFLGGAIKNRWDACVSNGIDGVSINFAPTDQYGVVSTNSAISYTLNSDSVNPMYWMQPDLQGIIMGTQAGEYLTLAPTAGSIAPNNVASRRVTKIGSANIEPVRTEHTNIFVQRYQRKLTEYFPDAYSGKFTGPNLAAYAEHIVSSGISELAYCSAAAPILWGRTAANALFGVTYKRDTLTTAQPPTFAGFHRHTLGSGRTIESLCSGPSVGGDLDTLSLVTNDATINIRHVEVMTDAPDENAALADAWFLDDAVNPTSLTGDPTPIVGAPFGGVTINGLWHLNGKTVQVFAAGLDCGDRGDYSTAFTDFAVTNGSCFVPYGDGIGAGPGRGLFTQAFLAALPLSQIVVGFTYNSDGQHVRRNEPAETGARTGPAFGKKRRIHRYSMLLSNTRALSVGTIFTRMNAAMFRQADDKTQIGALTAFSGVHQDSLNDDYSYDGMICWRVARPFPATVITVAGNLTTQDQ